MNSLTDTVTHGPFGKVQEQVNTIGLTLDREGKFWFSDNGYIDVFRSSDSILRQILQHHFHAASAVQVNTRDGFEDLDGFDHGLTTAFDKECDAATIEQLMIVRDGTFFTNHTISKFDSSKPALCTACHILDTREHRTPSVASTMR